MARGLVRAPYRRVLARAAQPTKRRVEFMDLETLLDMILNGIVGQGVGY